MTTSMLEAIALRLPYVDPVPLYDQLADQYGIVLPVVEPDSITTPDPVDLTVPSTAVEVWSPVEPIVPPVAPVVALASDLTHAETDADSVSEDVAPDADPVWENIVAETPPAQFSDGFEVLRDLPNVPPFEDEAPVVAPVEEDASFAAAPAADMTTADESDTEVEVEVEVDDFIDDDEVAPLWQDTVLPEPTEADIQANRTLLEEIAVYFGDDIPEMPPFAHDHSEQP